MKNKQAFIVDIGKTMIDTNRITSEGKDKQKLFCKCGHATQFDSKVKRNVVKNQDTTVEDKESLQSIKCSKCSTVYNYDNKVCLLIPDKEEIFGINFNVVSELNAKEEIITLYKRKSFALYGAKKDELTILNRVDFIRLNKTTRVSTIFLNQPSNDDDNQISSTSFSTDKVSENVSETITVSRLNKLEHFFKFFEFVQYEGLEHSFEFFKAFEETIIDLDVIKKIPAIGYLYKNNKIYEDIKKNGEIRFFQKVDSGYGDGVMVEKTLSVGSYLARTLEISKIFFAVFNFPNITTILLTKGKEFFNELLHSTNICNTNVYVKNDATAPAKIIEVSTNFEKSGGIRKGEEKKKKAVRASAASKSDVASKDVEDYTYLRISPVIYKHIKTPSDMDILLNVYTKGYLTKLDFETLFQTFDTDRLYRLYRQLDKKNNDEIALNMKHIKHILKDGLDDSKNTSTDFLTTYVDTIRVIGLLEINENYIFRIKNAKELKEVHDDLSARYNAVKDAKKADFYKKAAADFSSLNCLVGDIKITVVPTLEALNKEGMTMSHCVYTYLSRVCDRGYMVFHVQHILSNERATIGAVRKAGKSLEFEQLKGYKNSRATTEMINAVIKFCKDNDISVSNRNSDLTPSPGNQVRMHDYVSDEDVQKLKEERAKKEKKAKEKKAKDGKEDVEVANKAKTTKSSSKGFLGGLFE